MIYQCEPKEFNDYGYAAYYIEVDISNPRQSFQRHVWRRIGRLLFDEFEDWIPTFLHTKERLLKEGFKLKPLKPPFKKDENSTQMEWTCTEA